MKEAIFTLLGLVLGGGGVYLFVATKLQQKLDSAERKLERANRAMDDGEALREREAGQSQELQAAQTRIKSLEASYQSQLQELEARHGQELATLRENAPDLAPLQAQIEDLQGQLETQAAHHAQEKRELELRYNDRLEALEADYQEREARVDPPAPPVQTETPNPLGGLLGGIAGVAGAVGLAGMAGAFLGEREATESAETQTDNWVDAPAEPEGELESPFSAPEEDVENVRDWAPAAPELEAELAIERESADPFGAPAASWAGEEAPESFPPLEPEEFPLDSLLEEPEPLAWGDAEPEEILPETLELQGQEEEFELGETPLELASLEEESDTSETLELEALEPESNFPEILELESLEALTGAETEDFAPVSDLSLGEMDWASEAAPPELSLDNLDLEVPEAASDLSLDSFDLGAEPSLPDWEPEGAAPVDFPEAALELGWEGDVETASLEAFDLGLEPSAPEEDFFPGSFASDSGETPSLDDLSDPGDNLELPADFLAEMPSYHPELETESEELGQDSEIDFLLELQRSGDSAVEPAGEEFLLELGDEGEELPLMDLFPAENEAALEMPELPLSNPSDGMEPFINMLDISTETPDPELLEMLQGHHGDLDGEDELFGDLFSDSQANASQGLEDFLAGEGAKAESNPEEFSLDWDAPSS